MLLGLCSYGPCIINILIFGISVGKFGYFCMDFDAFISWGYFYGTLLTCLQVMILVNGCSVMDVSMAAMFGNHLDV
jgi:hypothetical protein